MTADFCQRFESAPGSGGGDERTQPCQFNPQLFGPNASGKTTVLRAIAFLKWFVEFSFDISDTDAIPFVPFLGKNSAESTTELSVELYGQTFKKESLCIYRYEVTFKNCAGQPSIVSFNCSKMCGFL